MTLLVRTVAPIWLLALVGAILVGILSPASEYLVFLAVVLGSVTIVTFVVQLGLTMSVGFVDRVAASVAGSVVILGAATAILAPLSFS